MKDHFESIYKVGGLLPDPDGVLEVIKSASEDDMPSIISQIKEQHLDLNPNIYREVEKYEHLRDMSS
mgnify:CR=1 FL=1